ncbi:MAG: S8 family serine peptidase [Actinomycetota bacterium]
MRRTAALIAALVCGSSLVSIQAHAAPASHTAGANAVVSLVDTGINPYHETFRDNTPRAYRYPGTYIPGYPKNATALHLTLDAPDYWTAVHADCERIWSKIQPGKLYWIPGTKIIGAITFEKPDKLNCADKKPAAEGHILDAQGHGTMTSSRATSVDYGACPECRTVMVQFPTSINLLSPGGSTAPAISAIKWAANNAGWIDAQSNSWGPLVPVWDPTGQVGLVGANPELVRAVEEVSKKHLAFWASGNGAAFRGGAVGHPTLLSPHLTPSAIIVGGDDSGYMSTWPGFPPDVVSDSCDSWAA